MVYTYRLNTNTLSSVLDNANNTSGFNDFNKLGDDYTYDTNGNMITDKNKKINAIIYNHLNLPTKITFGATGNIVYIYNAAGQKLEKIVNSLLPTATVTTTNYLGGYQYQGVGTATPTLQFFPTAEGYVKNTVVNSTNNYSYVFNYTDHLGNVRLSYSDNITKDGIITSNEIVEENNYYPFGLKHKGYNANNLQPSYKYKYNGKELQDELGLNVYDYGARNYMPDLGRWGNIDPLAEKYFDMTPYNYVANTPINAIDPDGMDKYIVNDDGKTILALKQKGDDILYAIDRNGNLKDTNKDKKTDEKDGLTVKSEGLLSQLTNYRSGSGENGARYFSSIGEQSEQHEKDYLNIFKYMSDNTGAEFSLTFFEGKSKNWIELATYRDDDSAPSPDNLGKRINYSKVKWHAHNHPPGYASEMSSMGILGGDLKSGDALNAINNKRSYPNYVYFPESKKLYNVTMYGIEYIKKINTPKDLKK